MESWRLVWRRGFAPQLTPAALAALRAGLRADDPNLIQGATSVPPPLMCVQDWPVEGADAISYGGWKGDGIAHVGDLSAYFARLCFEADQLLGEPAACRWFLNWWDETPRHDAREGLIFEVERTIADRATCPLCGKPLNGEQIAHTACALAEQGAADLTPGAELRTDDLDTPARGGDRAVPPEVTPFQF